MRPENFNVYIVEDDASIRDALGLLLGLRGFSVSIFADAESFLSAYQSEWTGCMLIDIRMPGMDGLSLQSWLTAHGCRMPVIVMTGHGDVGSARQAFRAEAIDFLEKPIDQGRLLQAIEEARDRCASVSAGAEATAAVRHRMEALTPREREVMEHVVAGRHNRDIALDLGISVRTVEVHKSRIMMKLQTDSVASLVRLNMMLERPV
jgi:FixJ family two-component response regulator